MEGGGMGPAGRCQTGDIVASAASAARLEGFRRSYRMAMSRNERTKVKEDDVERQVGVEEVEAERKEDKSRRRTTKKGNRSRT